MFKKTLLYCGMVTKNTDGGLKWIFTSPNEKCLDLTAVNYWVFSESEYFNQRKLDFSIEFVKEPPKTVT